MPGRNETLEKWQLDIEPRVVDTENPPGQEAIRLTDFVLLVDDHVSLGDSNDEVSYARWYGFADGRAALAWLRYEILPAVEAEYGDEEDEEDATDPEDDATALVPSVRPLARLLDGMIGLPDPEGIDWPLVIDRCNNVLGERLSPARILDAGRVPEMLEQYVDDFDYGDWLDTEGLRDPEGDPDEDDADPAPFAESELERIGEGTLDPASPRDVLLANVVLAAAESGEL